MATAILSQQTIEEAHALAQQSSTWNPGRSKLDGRSFYNIPSRSEPGVSHYVTNYGCTCKGFRRRGNCAHMLAVELSALEDDLKHTAAEKRYEDYWPACAAGCGDLVDRTGESCYACASNAARMAR